MLFRSPNYESPTDSGADNAYDVTVQVSDGSLTDTQDIAVTVTDANEAPTALAISATSIAENNAVNAVIGSFTTTDPDAANTFSYALVSGTGDADNGSFAISGNQLQAGASFNFEAKASYTIRVRATDQGGLSYDKVFSIGVTNVNEAPSVTSAATATVAENTTAAQTVTATDPDAGTTLVYSIVDGADAAKFSINAGTGALAFLAAPNFESPTDVGGDNVYEVTVQVSDGSLTATRDVAVTVTNVNEAPAITSSAAVSVGENTTAAQTVTATDPDAEIGRAHV